MGLASLATVLAREAVLRSGDAAVLSTRRTRAPSPPPPGPVEPRLVQALPSARATVEPMRQPGWAEGQTVQVNRPQSGSMEYTQGP